LRKVSDVGKAHITLHHGEVMTKPTVPIFRRDAPFLVIQCFLQAQILFLCHLGEILSFLFVFDYFQSQVVFATAGDHAWSPRVLVDAALPPPSIFELLPARLVASFPLPFDALFSSGFLSQLGGLAALVAEREQHLERFFAVLTAPCVFGAS